MNYQEAKNYLDSLINYEKKSLWFYKESLKLERLIEFLKELDNPYKGLNYLHVAGTKGKGSVCAFLSYILREAGFKVGLYTSPHLSNFRERIRILDSQSKVHSPQSTEEFEGMIFEEQVCDLVERLKPSIEEFNKESKFGFLTFFEVYTTMAFLYFQEKKVDFAVLETGLGGKLDATNVVEPLVCGITQISYEHTQKLGNTLREIATEKAGIIKNRIPYTVYREPSIVISSPQEAEAKDVIRNRCKETGVKLYEVGKNIFFEDKGFDGIYQNFSVWSIFSEYSNLKIRLLGLHQVINAATAIGIIETLRFYNIFISPQAIREGLVNTLWPGRLEVISKDPFIVLDGAQNSASAKALKEAIKRFFNYKRLVLVLGISKDKDFKGICNELSETSDEIILTKADNPRACEPEFIKSQILNVKVPAEGRRVVGGLESKILLTKDSKEAIEMAKLKAERQDLILITGSLFLVGEIRDYLKQNIWR